MQNTQMLLCVISDLNYCGHKATDAANSSLLMWKTPHDWVTYGSLDLLFKDVFGLLYTAPT